MTTDSAIPMITDTTISMSTETTIEASVIETSKPEDFVIENGLVIAYNGTSPHIILPKEAERVAADLFIHSAIESVVIPEGWTHIPNEMFFECFKLKEVTLPSTLECIGSHAFYCCIALRHISLPDSLKEIRFSAFTESGLDEIVFPESLNEIGAWAFKDCPYLKKVTFPKSAVTMEYDTFLRCTKLETLEGIESIGEEKVHRHAGEAIPHTELSWWDVKFIFRNSPVGDIAVEKIKQLDSQH